MGIVVRTDAWVTRLERTPAGHVVRGPVRPFVDVMNRPGEKRYDRLVLATRALRRNAASIEANVEIGCANRDPARRLFYLERAVAAGERLWLRALRDVGDQGLWDAEPAARPWLEAMSLLEITLGYVGDHDRQRELLEHVVALGPNDELGAAVHLMAMPAV